jgi:hypothetical protein
MDKLFNPDAGMRRVRAKARRPGDARDGADTKTRNDLRPPRRPVAANRCAHRRGHPKDSLERVRLVRSVFGPFGKVLVKV